MKQYSSVQFRAVLDQTGCLCSCGSRLVLQAFDHGMVEPGTHLFDGLIGTVRPGAVGQQCDRELPLRVNPERSTRVAKMAEGTRTEMFAGLRRGRWRIPPQRSRSAFRFGLTASEQSQCLWAKNWSAAVQHDVSEDSQIPCSSEQTRMSRDSAQHARVLVLHFAVNDPLAKSAIVHRGRNVGAPGSRRLECRMNHSEGTENLALAEGFERFIGDAFQSNTQDDEPDVAINGERAGLRDARGCEGRMQELFAVACVQAQLA